MTRTLYAGLSAVLAVTVAGCADVPFKQSGRIAEDIRERTYYEMGLYERDPSDEDKFVPTAQFLKLDAFNKSLLDPTLPPTKADASTVAAIASARTAEDKIKERIDAFERFSGANFGAGFSVIGDVSGRPRIDEAEIVNGVVRAKTLRKAIPTIMLESHYFFTPDEDLPAIGLERGRWGWGPFLAVQASEKELIEAFGFGAMVGFRFKDDLKNSFNIGIGGVVDPDVKTLGRGFKDGRPPPTGETQVRFREETRFGVLFTVSFGF